MTDDEKEMKSVYLGYNLHRGKIQAQIDILNWVLENCSGGGNWRRKCEQKIAELEGEV